MQHNKMFYAAIIASMFTCYSANAQEILPKETTESIEQEVNQIKTATSKLDVSEELKEYISENIHRNYIIFYEQIWNKLPQAKLNRKVYSLNKNENKIDFHIGAIYDENFLAIISKFKDNNKPLNEITNDTIKDTLYFGILPSFYPEGVSVKEINEISRINIITPYTNSNIKKTQIIFRGDLIESYYMPDINKGNSSVKIFSISKITKGKGNTEYEKN